MIILETARLYLRKFAEGDIHTLHPIFSDEKTMRYYPAPFSIYQTKDWVKKNLERYEKDGYGLWGVCLKETDELIGDCGLVKQLVEGKAVVEIGYHIKREHWSKGYATEAAGACKDFGFNQLKLTKLISIIDPQNLPSIRVAEKIGFQKEREAFIFNKDHIIYSGKKNIKGNGGGADGAKVA